MSKCWYCNNELTTGDSPKHFGICNKCYDGMFKSGDTIIRSLTDKIAELQKQLEETKQTGSYQVMLMCQKENILLKQQLKSQPREIIERIKGQLLAICQIRQYHRSDEMIMNFQAFNNVLDTILKEYDN